MDILLIVGALVGVGLIGGLLGYYTGREAGIILSHKRAK